MSETAVYGAVNIDPWGKPRIGDWIQTYGGRKFHLLDPRPEDFDIEDIASALSNICRFTGHTSRRGCFGRRMPAFYSVAEHSVRVARAIRQKLGRLSIGSWVYAGLMHDSTEAFICDMARPFKQLPEFAFYREIESTLQSHLASAFQFEDPLPKCVKEADEILLGTEARDLMEPCIDGWHFRYEHLPERIKPWSPRKAKREFLKLFYELNPLGIKKPSKTRWLFNRIMAEAYLRWGD